MTLRVSHALEQRLMNHPHLLCHVLWSVDCMKYFLSCDSVYRKLVCFSFSNYRIMLSQNECFQIKILTVFICKSYPPLQDFCPWDFNKFCMGSFLSKKGEHRPGNVIQLVVYMPNTDKALHLVMEYSGCMSECCIHKTPGFLLQVHRPIVLRLFIKDWTWWLIL